MSVTAIPQRDWQTIVERIHAGQCVPFLGAGVNASGEGYEGLPLGPQLALRLAEDLIAAEATNFEELAKVEILNEALNEYPQLLRLQLQDLARVAFHLERVVDNPHLIGLVRRVLEDRNRVPSRLLKTIARLPVRLIVTTNYDLLMEKALDEAGREYSRVVQPIGGFHPLELGELNEGLAAAKASGTLILYKIHGTFPDAEGQNGDSDRIIITEEDYIEFLTVVGDEQIGIPPAIKSEMTTATLLFLGYSLEDWDFRTIFKGTIERLERYETFKSFAIQLDPSPLWVKFWEQEKKVVIHDMNLHKFAEQLEENYDTYVAKVSARQADG